MSDIGEQLTAKKIGKVPVIWYVLGIGVGVGLWYYQKRNKSADEETTPLNMVTSPIGSADTPSQTATQPTNNGETAVNTNAAWSLRVANTLVATGDYNALDVSNAVAHYLGGVPLSAKEAAIIAIAITRFGQPPEGVIPVTVKTDPAPTQTPTPTPTPTGLDRNTIQGYYHTYLGRTASSAELDAWARSSSLDAVVAGIKGSQEYLSRNKTASAPAPAPAQHTYTVQPGDNLTRIATRFYGNSNWQKIYDANRGVIGGNPNLIRPGQVIVIP